MNAWAMPVSRAYHVMIGSTASGPFPTAKLAEMIRMGELKPSDYVRGEHETEWVPLSSVLGSPPPVMMPAVMQESPAAVLPPAPREEIEIAWSVPKWLAAGVMLFAALLFWSSKSSFGQCTGLAMFAGAVIAAMYAFATKPNRAALAVAVLTVYCIYYKINHDIEYTSYTNSNGDDISERRLAWSGRAIWRRISKSQGSITDLATWSQTESEGPLSETDRWHGKWTFRSHYGDSGVQQVRWYWYGDEVTEGEWMLRNRD